MAPNPSGHSPPPPGPLHSTAELLSRVRGGDEDARNELVIRYLPILRAWGHGRLRGRARSLAETDDLVQMTLIRALNRVDQFEPRREGAFLAYLRQILINAVRYEVRRTLGRPAQEELDESLRDPSPVEETVGRETLMDYESALRTLPELQQQAVVLRVEFGFSFREIAEAVGSPSANAARMMVTRALVRLAEEMDG